MTISIVIFTVCFLSTQQRASKRLANAMQFCRFVLRAVRFEASHRCGRLGIIQPVAYAKNAENTEAFGDD